MNPKIESRAVYTAYVSGVYVTVVTTVLTAIESRSDVVMLTASCIYIKSLLSCYVLYIYANDVYYYNCGATLLIYFTNRYDIIQYCATTQQ